MKIDLIADVHLSIQSATENFRNAGTPANAYALLELDPRRGRLQVFGNDPVEYEL
jgi:hypothetical protein